MSHALSRSVMRAALGMLAVGAAFGAGWASGRNRHADTSAGEADRASSAAPAALPGAGVTRAPLPDRPAFPGNEAGYDTLRDTLLAWAQEDPIAALDWARRNIESSRCDAFLAAILEAWASREPDAAWGWVSARAETNLTLLDAVLAETGKVDPAQAWRFANAWLASDPHHHEFAQTILVSALRGCLYRGDYALAASFAQGVVLPGGAPEFDLSSLVAGEWGLYQPEQAAAWLAAMPEDGSYRRQQATVSLGTSWVRSDPQAAADFAAKLPPGITRQNTLAVALDAWASRQPEAAGEWLVRQPNHPDFDQVVLAVATSPALAERDVHAAISWADTMRDDDLRRMALGRIIGDWMRRDEAGAEHYLATTAELDPKLVKAIRESMPVAVSPVFGP